MVSKLKKVFSTYTSTWSFWIVVFVVIPLVFVVGPVVSQIDDYSRAMPEPTAWRISIVKNKPVDPKTIEITKSVDDQVANSKTAEVEYKADYEVDWDNFDMNADGVRVLSLHDESMWDRFAAMPHLEFLDLKYVSFWRSTTSRLRSKSRRTSRRGAMSLDDLKNLKRISKLKSLRLPIANYEVPHLDVLKELEGLQWLDISFGQLREGLKILPVLNDLEVLHIRYSELLSEEGVAHLNSFPKLKTVIVSKLSFEEPSDDEMAQLIASQSENIKRLSRVETLYLPHQMVYGPMAKQLTGENRRVYPSEYNETRNAISFFTFVILLLLSASLGVMLIIQFSRPESQLIPGYNKPHCYVAGVLIAIAIAGGAFVMVLVGVDLIVAIAVALFSTSFLGLLSCSSRFSPFSFLLFFGLIGSIVLLAPFDVSQVYLERFLVGLHPAATAIVGAFGAIVTTLGVIRMRFVYKVYAEAGIDNPTILMANPKMNGGFAMIRSIQDSSKTPKSSIQSWAEALVYPPDIKYSQLFAKVRISKEERNFRIWKLATGMTGKATLYTLAVIAVVIQVCFYFQYLIKGILPPKSLSSDVVVGVLIGIAPIYIAPLMSGGWYRRMPMMSREFCMPISRRKLIENLCRGFLNDVRWLPFIPVICVSPVLFLTHSLSESLFWLAAYLAIAVGSMCFVYGVMIWTFQIREYWKLTLLYVVEIAFVMFVFISIGFLSTKPSSLFQVMPAQYWFLISGIALGVLGLLITRYAKDRWSRLEFAKLV